MLLATRNVEIFQNEISDNRTIGTAIVSYELVKALGEDEDEDSQMAGNISDYESDKDYDPYPKNIFMYANEFSNSYWFPTLKNDFGKLFLTKFPFSTPDIAVDGIVSPDQNMNLCLSENGEFRFANLDADNDFEGLSTDWSKHACEGQRLSALVLD